MRLLLHLLHSPDGPPRALSEKPERVVATINGLSSRGYREVVLTGIHLGFFGRGSGQGGLQCLLNRVEKECEIDSVRLSSIETNEVSEEILNLIADSKKFCHHLHVPLQSGDDGILHRMGRNYSSAFFIQRIEEIREKIPDIGITTDLMVGFPGETHEQFEHTCEVVEDVGFTKIHVFRFSPRPGTKAAEMGPPVPPKTISARARHLIKVGEASARRFKERFVGETVRVLVESFVDDGSCCVGLASNYIRVKVLGASADCVNRILPVRLTGLDVRTGVSIGRPI